MNFAKEVDGNIISGEFTQLWPNITAHDQAEFAGRHGFSPVLALPPYDPVFEQLTRSEVYYQNGFFYEFEAVPADLNKVKAYLHGIVAKERVDAEQAGLVYHFPDKIGTVQTRDERDIRNVQAQVLAALILSGQGITDPVMTFRDAENETHAMTPTEMMTMGMTVSAQISAMYQNKWVKDDQIENLADVAAARVWYENNVS